MTDPKDKSKEPSQDKPKGKSTEPAKGPPTTPPKGPSRGKPKQPPKDEKPPAAKVRYNKVQIRAFLLKWYVEVELTELCEKHFEEVIPHFSESWSLVRKAGYLVRWLDRRGSGQINKLVAVLKEERSERFSEWKEKLTSVDSSSPYEQISDEARDLGDLFAAREAESPPRPEPKPEPVGSDAPHPLAGSLNEVRSWFVEELSNDEKVFVVTAALFNGLEQQELLSLYEDVSKILQAHAVAENATTDAADVDDKAPGAEQRIHLDISLSEQTARVRQDAKPAETPLFVDETAYFRVADLVTVDGQKNTEHGVTPVRLIDFRSEERRLKIIRLLGTSFSKVASRVAPYLVGIGGHRKVTLRRRAAEAAGELMREGDFTRYKSEILIPWALSDNLLMNSAVGVAMATAAESERHSENVKLLIKNWVTSSNLDLIWSGVGACAQVGSLWPEDTLGFMEKALKLNSPPLHVLTVVVLDRLCESGHRHLVLEKLEGWATKDRRGSQLGQSAIVVFFGVIQAEHIVDDEKSAASAAAIFQRALSGYPGDYRGPIRDAALDILKRWAARGFDEPSIGGAVTDFFRRLCAEAPTDRDRERIRFKVNRWSREDERFRDLIVTC